jgi:hypothetical protein
MKMNQIERLFKKQPIFQGVYSSDTLPKNPGLLICNIDPSAKPGKHWIAIYMGDDGRGEYFDSFGRAPYEHYEHYMNSYCHIWTFNKR